MPAVLLAKLAVDRTAQTRGLGRLLLGHAARQALQVRDRVGVRLLVTEARDKTARTWYLNHGMTALQDGRTCYVRLTDLTADPTWVSTPDLPQHCGARSIEGGDGWSHSLRINPDS